MKGEFGDVGLDGEKVTEFNNSYVHKCLSP